jgi:hypothetical protein
LHIPENFLVTFLILILFTSFQHPSGITLKKIRLKDIPVEFGSKTATAPAFLDLRAVASKFFQFDSRDPVPATPEPFINGSHWLLTEEPTLCHTPICKYSSKVGSAGSIFF